MYATVCCCIVICFLVVFSNGASENSWTVTSTVLHYVQFDVIGGRINGSYVQSEKGNRAVTFFGIPYAESPIGSLRFMPPVERRPWSGIMDNTKYGQQCWQNATGHPNPYDFATMGDDCLTVNIFTPVSGLDTSSEKVPVLYYIHGGGNDYDFPAMFPSDKIIDNFVSHGIVVVTVGYRLNTFGFWTTGTKDAPGNTALRDTLLGLQWVHDEIGQFGGDTSRITIMGHSSSADVVSLMTLMDDTKELFHQAVVMSGPLSAGEVPNASYREFADSVNCTTGGWTNENFQNVVQCMQAIPSKDLVNYFIPFLGTSEMWLDKSLFSGSIESMQSNRRKVNTLTGTLRTEFPFFANASRESINESCNKTISQSFPDKPRGTILEAVLQCTNLYVGSAEDYSSYYRNKTLPEDNGFFYWRKRQEELTNDITFFIPTLNQAQTLVNAGSTVFLYSMDFDNSGGGRGSYHSFDLTYVMGMHPFEYNDQDVWIDEHYPKLFMQFIKYGNPTKEPVAGTRWRPLNSKDSFNYLSIDYENIQNRDDYHSRSAVFWLDTLPSLFRDEIGDQTVPSLEKKNLPINKLVAEKIQNYAQSLKSVNEPNLPRNSSPVSGTTLTVGIIASVFALVLLALVVVHMTHRRVKSKPNDITMNEYAHLISDDEEELFYRSF